jgi:hypothetical protein
MSESQLFRNEARLELENSVSRVSLGNEFYQWPELYLLFVAVVGIALFAALSKISIDVTVAGVLRTKKVQDVILADRDGVLTFIVSDQRAIKTANGEKIAVIRSLDPETIRRAPNIEFTHDQLMEKKQRLNDRLKILQNGTAQKLGNYADLKNSTNSLIVEIETIKGPIADDIKRLQFQVVKSGIIAKEDLGALQSKLVDRQAQLSDTVSKIDQFRQKISEYDLQIKQVKDTAEKDDFDIHSQLNDIELALRTDTAVTERTLVAKKDELLLPRGFSTGQVVKAGDVLFEVSHDDNVYQIESDISAADVGDLKEGQPVTISLTSYPFFKYGLLKGRLSFVSPIPKTRLAFSDKLPTTADFRTVVEPDAEALKTYLEGKTLYPGMTAEVHIKKKSVRLWRLLLSPLFRLSERMEI